MPVTGKGRKGILIVAEAPGKNEDREGVQLIGDAGQELRKHLNDLGCDLDRDCWKTNAVICRPPENVIKDVYVDCCRPNLFNTIKKLQPETVILLGMKAVKSFLLPIWGGSVDADSLGQWVGWCIPLHKPNVWCCPTWHPSYLLRVQQPALTLWFRKHLEQALSKRGRPWDEVPNYMEQIRIEESDVQASKMIRMMAEKAGDNTPIAFDYETDRLKPDHPEAELVSCAICWQGRRTLAFPWTPKTAEAVSEVLRSTAPKIGANIKFEQRWTKTILGHNVRNWVWDCMQASHVLDCRPAITSVKFQAFVRLGQPLWSSKVDDFLKASYGNSRNKIRQVKLYDLLKYNGMDALMEYLVGMDQMREMGVVHGW